MQVPAIALSTALALMLAAGAGPAEARVSKKVVDYLTITPEAAELKVSTVGADDKLETTVTVTTEPLWRAQKDLFGTPYVDSFLRAHVDKTTGEARFQVYFYHRYHGSGWRFYQLANFETPTGPRQVEITSVRRDVDCSNRFLGCEHREDTVFSVDEETLRAMAARRSDAQSLSGWNFRMKAQSGQSFDDTVAFGEIGGLLRAVDRYRVEATPSQ